MRAIKTSVISILAIGLLAGSAVGVAAQDDAADPMAPSTFSGAIDAQPDFSTDPDTGLTLMVAPFEATDPRASGTWTSIIDGAVVEDDKRDYRVQSVSNRLVNDGGAWVGTSRFAASKKLPNGNDKGGNFQELTGEGGYEGLSMFIHMTFGGGNSVVRGIIVPTDMVPAMPPPPAAAE